MRRFALLVMAAAALSGCDKPKPRTPPPEPAPPYADRAPPLGLRERASPVRWDESAETFVQDGKPLRIGKLWTFDNATDGFTLLGGQASIEAGGGLHLTNTSGDPILLSPKGLDVSGSRFPMVVVRLTRVARGGAWAGSLFYFTTQHGPSEKLRTNPADPRDPAVNETVTLVYDLSKAPAAEDWAASTIEQLRFDTDDQTGGEFVIRQVAIAGPAVASEAAETPAAH